MAGRIRILITGGTFDKEYDELRSRLYFQDSHLPVLPRQPRAQEPADGEARGVANKGRI